MTAAPAITVSPAIAALKAGFDSTSPKKYTDVTTALKVDGSFVLDPAPMKKAARGKLSDGKHTLHVQATDAAGNVSGLADVAFTLDSTLPMVTAALARDTGSSVKDRITTDDTISGKVTEINTVAGLKAGFDVAAPGRLLRCLHGPAGGPHVRPHACAAAQVAGGTLADGVHVLHVLSTDAAGNVSRQANVSFTLDTTPPAVTAALTRDTGSSNNDRLTFRPHGQWHRRGCRGPGTVLKGWRGCDRPGEVYKRFVEG